MKKNLRLTVVLTIILFLSGCRLVKKDSTSDSAHSFSGSSPTESVEYNGTVKEDGITNEQQLTVSNLKPVEANERSLSFDEVILLTKEVPLLNAETHEKVNVEDIKAGTSVTVFLIPEPITTRSLPPQIPGNSILKILVSKK
ncbi:hypothetical protein [Carnobacterium antarcticum]|uniref:Lipoprotein n=1 Tax=Carnobacterium antarcticum TaxID=2126436 RepID=A0ABW4NNZ2_9LACT|nr:hypothetical protein [Carnobacterium sp. CP1]ALV22694.1 hypothetical protein NY10_2107 [Carnobacterium sp. CP1]